MMSRELLVDVLQRTAGPRSVVTDDRRASSVADLCLRLFEGQAELAAEIRRTEGDAASVRMGSEVPDIRVYDSAALEHSCAKGEAVQPLRLGSMTQLVRARKAAPGDAA